MSQEPSREQLEAAERFLTNRGMFPHEIEAIAPPLAAFLAARDVETIRPWAEALKKMYSTCTAETCDDGLAIEVRALLSSHPVPNKGESA